MIEFLVFIFFAFVLYSFYEYYNIKVRRVSLSDHQHFHKVPDEFKGKKIVFVSDLQFDHHIGGFDHLAVKKLMKKIEEENPDLLVLGGDMIHNDTSMNYKIFDYLKELKMEKIAILGNHDYRDLMTVYKGLDDANIKLLVNSKFEKFGINFYGVDDFRKGKPKLLVNEDEYTIALCHNPAFAMKLNKSSIDLVLSGHFHGGQISFFGLYAPAMTSHYGQLFRYGHVPLDHTDVYVSSGVGGKVLFLPMRFFAPPEIVVLEA